MRSISRVLAAVVCTLWLAAPTAFADDVRDELAEMRALVEQMQGQIEAQSEQIQHQGTVIRESRDAQVGQNERYGASGISAFLQRLEIEGWVAGSYFYNFKSPSEGLNYGPGANSGLSGNVYPFHGNHNSFQVDQVWFGIEHPVDEENRAGFRFDLVFGDTACWLGNSFGNNCNGNNTSELYVNQAYVQYLAPYTDNGILVKAGKFATPVGAEVAQTTGNFNITRGNVYNMLQPIDHMGVLVSSDVGESGFSWAAGASNGGSAFGADPDFNSAKALIGQVAWAGETIGASSTLIWDPSFGGSTQTGLFDIVLTWDPSERLSTWLNFDYAWAEVPGKDNHGYGIATAGRYAVTDRVGVSTRLEWVRTTGPAWWVGTANDTDLFGITGTVDYALTNNLMVRGEVRFDTVAKDGSNDEFFNKNGNNLTSNQTTAGVEVVYEF